MHPAQWIVGVRVVIELGLRPQRRPTRSRVAVLTRDREIAMRIAKGRLPRHGQRYNERRGSANEPFACPRRHPQNNKGT